MTGALLLTVVLRAALPAGEPSVSLAELLVARADQDGDPRAAGRARDLLLAARVRDGTTEILLARALLLCVPADHGRALEALHRAKAAGGDPLLIAGWRGLVAAALGDHSGAKPLLQQAAAGSRPDVRVLLALARIQIEDGRLEEAEHELRGTAPFSAEADFMLAQLASRRDDEATALGRLDATLAREPAHLGARLLRAQRLARAGRDTEAQRERAMHAALIREAELARRPRADAPAAAERLQLMGQLTELDPGQGEWWLRLARLHAAVGDARGAAGTLRRAEPSLTSATLAAGAAALVARSDPPLAERHARRALADASAPPATAAVAQLALGAVLLARGELADAEGLLRAAAGPLAHRPDVHEILADLLLARDDRDGAMRELGVALELDPDDVRALANLGALEREAGRPGLALERLDRACRLDSTDVGAQANRGLALHDLGRTQEAIAAMELAVRLAPDEPQLRINLAALLGRAGRAADAAPHVERVLASPAATSEQRETATRLLRPAASTSAPPRPK